MCGWYGRTRSRWVAGFAEFHSGVRWLSSAFGSNDCHLVTGPQHAVGGTLALSYALRRGGTVSCCMRGTGARGLDVAGPFSPSSTVRGVFVPCAVRRALCLVGTLIAIACVGFSSEAGSNKGFCHCTWRFWLRSTVKSVECTRVYYPNDLRAFYCTSGTCGSHVCLVSC